jgi:hydroxymethylglutaryl-CoA reductase (NADPH)
MVTVPAFLLKRLYVKGSLKPTSDGFEFRVENKLGSGYATQMLPLTLDGVEFPLEVAYFCPDGGEEIRFSDVNTERTMTLEVGRGLAMGVHGAAPLAPGPHKVGLGFVVQGISALSFEVSDVVA